MNLFTTMSNTLYEFVLGDKNIQTAYTKRRKEETKPGSGVVVTASAFLRVSVILSFCSLPSYTEYLVPCLYPLRTTSNAACCPSVVFTIGRPPPGRVFQPDVSSFGPATSCWPLFVFVCTCLETKCLRVISWHFPAALLFRQAQFGLSSLLRACLLEKMHIAIVNSFSAVGECQSIVCTLSLETK